MITESKINKMMQAVQKLAFKMRFKIAKSDEQLNELKKLDDEHLLLVILKLYETK